MYDARVHSLSMTLDSFGNCSSALNESALLPCDDALCDLYGCSLLDYAAMTGGAQNASDDAPGPALEAQVGLIPDSFQAAYRLFFTYFATVWCAFSILSNTATIMVLNHRSMKSTTNFLLTAVACSNLVIGSLYLPFAVYFYIVRQGEMNTLSHFMATMLWLFVPTMLCTHMIQMWMTVTVTTFRLLYVKYAHRSQELCNTRRAKFALAAVTLGCIVLSIPCLVGHKVMQCVEAYPADKYPGVCEPPDATENSSNLYYTVHLEKETDGQMAIFKSMLLWINSVIAKFLPAVLLCGLSAMLVSTMKDADKRRRHLRQRSERDFSRRTASESGDERDKKTNRTTRLLVVIAIMFIITYLPQSTIELIGSFLEVVRVEIGEKLGDVSDTLSLLNSGMTFILYCFMSQQFRTVFSQVFIHPLARRCGLKQAGSAVTLRRCSSVRMQKGRSRAAVKTASNGERRGQPLTVKRQDSSDAKNNGLHAPLAEANAAPAKNLQVMILHEATEPLANG